MRYVVRWFANGQINSQSVATLGDAEYLAWHWRGNGAGSVQILSPIDLVQEALAQA